MLSMNYRLRKVGTYCFFVGTVVILLKVAGVLITKDSHKRIGIRMREGKQNNVSSTAKSNLQEGKPYDILINSYMRSGSSFLGRLLAWRPDTFYWYEPLWNYDSGVYYWGKDLLCVGKNLCGLAKNKTKHNLGLVHATFDNIYNCNLSALSAAMIENITLIHSGKIWEPYEECRKRKSLISECLQQMERICKTSKHKATKTVRLTLDNLELTLKTNPDVKLIHLFRDPRAIMNSRLTTKWFGLREMGFRNNKVLQEDASDLCNRIIHDFRAGIRLKKMFPNRFSFVLFEDLMEDQEIKSKLLFDFFGLEMRSYNSSNIEVQMPSDDHKLTRRNSKNFADWWRMQLSVDALDIVDRSCTNAMEFIGYKRFYSEDNLRNLSIKAYVFQHQYKLENIFETDHYEL